MSTGTPARSPTAMASVDRVEDARPLVADVRREEAAVLPDDGAERHEVVGGDRQLARGGQHGREAERPVAHRLIEQRLHRLELLGVGPAERVSQHAFQQRSQADIAGDVGGDAPASSASK